MKRLEIAAVLLACACEVSIDVRPADAGPGAASSDAAAAAPGDAAKPPSPADAALAHPDGGPLPGLDAASPASDGGRAPDAASPDTVTVTYTVDSTTNFANPERGFYHHEETQSTGYSALDSATLTSYRAQQAISLVLRMWYLADFATKDFDQGFLAKVSADFDQVRSAGLKVVVRFAYSDSESASPRDANKAQILRHIAQLEPALQANADIIAAVQAGFVGVWGEWYYTDYFGDLGTISPAQWADRKEVVSALLAAVPSRTVLLRTPLFKTTMYGPAALTAQEAFTGTDRARVGHHNDCFLASADDFGTYVDVAAQKAYLAQETLYVPLGGETCATSTYSGWTNAASEMALLHWSFLNIDYNAAVYASWGANLEIAKRSLGYRLALVDGTYPSSVPKGADLTVSMTIRNDGYAPPYNPRALELVLRDAATGSVHALPLDADARRWAPGPPSAFNGTVSLAGVPAGSYDLLLNLPDPSPALGARPEYSIRLADVGLWEASTGFNKLNHSLTITP